MEGAEGASTETYPMAYEQLCEIAQQLASLKQTQEAVLKAVEALSTSQSQHAAW